MSACSCWYAIVSSRMERLDCVWWRHKHVTWLHLKSRGTSLMKVSLMIACEDVRYSYSDSPVTWLLCLLFIPVQKYRGTVELVCYSDSPVTWLHLKSRDNSARYIAVQKDRGTFGLRYDIACRHWSRDLTVPPLRYWKMCCFLLITPLFMPENFRSDYTPSVFERWVV